MARFKRQIAKLFNFDVINARVQHMRIISLVCLLLLSSCYMPPAIPVVNTPIPVQLRELFLRLEDLPRLSTAIDWHQTEPHNQLEQWAWTNAIDAVDVLFTHGTSISVLQSIVQYGDSIGAESIWREMRDHGVEPKLSGTPVDILSERELLPHHAENIALHCENYYNEGSSVPSHTNCVARLQYDVLYVEIRTGISGGTISKSKFYELIQAADRRLRPIWENSYVPTVTSPLATPIPQPLPTQ